MTGQCKGLIVLGLVALIALPLGGYMFFAPAAPVNAGGKQMANEKIDDTTPRTNVLFKQADPAVYRLARKIEREEPITADEVKALPQGALNARYGSEITLLFHALSAYNLQAIDVLLGAGADPYMVDHLERSGRDFTYYMGAMNMSRRPDLGKDFKTELIRLYLKHGGDPNHRLPSNAGTPFFYYVALMDNYDGVEVLLDAGADPLAYDLSEGDNVVNLLAGNLNKRSRELVKRIVCGGAFDHANMKAVSGIIAYLSPSGPSNPEREMLYKKLAVRILKYHPEIKEDYHTNRIFNGSIPWKEILEANEGELCK